MDSQQGEKQEQNKPNKNQESKEQHGEKREERKSTNADKFTWHPGDLEFFKSIDDMPGFKPNPGIEHRLKRRKTKDNQQTNKETRE